MTSQTSPIPENQRFPDDRFTKAEIVIIENAENFGLERETVKFMMIFGGESAVIDSTKFIGELREGTWDGFYVK